MRIAEPLLAVMPNDDVPPEYLREAHRHDAPGTVRKAGGGGVPRPSRCLDVANAPQVIHWAAVGGDPKVVSEELVSAVKLSVPPGQVVDAVSDIQALLGRIEHCQAVDPDDVVPVARYEYMWELRVDDKASGVHLRIYCAELPELPHTVIALHAHAKFVAGTDAEIKKRQDEAISVAALRFEAGEKSLWGIK